MKFDPKFVSSLMEEGKPLPKIMILYPPDWAKLEGLDEAIVTGMLTVYANRPPIKPEGV